MRNYCKSTVHSYTGAAP